MKLKNVAKSVSLAMFLVTAASANAASINTSLNFDNVASGTLANNLLGADASFMRFANTDLITDAGYDPLDPDAPSHWIDASATYGDVLVKSNSALFGNYAVSGSNVLWNDHAPIMISFSEAVNINSFSIQQDISGFGYPGANGTFLAFLDSTGHVISNLNQYYTQTDQNVPNNPGKGLLISASNISNVYGILLAANVNYDNFSINASSVAAVPEADSAAMFMLGLGFMGIIARRRKA